MSTLTTFPHAGPLATVRHGEEAHELLVFKLAPLLAVCEFAARAEHSLRAFEMLAGLDANVRQQLDGIAPEWHTPMVTGGVAQEVGQCLALARELCTAGAEQTQSLAHELLAFKLAPLLAVCEFAARAEHSLRAFEMLAGMDANMRQHLDGIAPEWRTPIVTGGVAQEVGQCLALARELCTAAAKQAQSLALDAAALRRVGASTAEPPRPAAAEPASAGRALSEGNGSPA